LQLRRQRRAERTFEFSIAGREDDRRVDRASLEKLLNQGLSLAEIGRRFGRHESTVAYWVQKYGLEAVNRERTAPKGGLSREELEPLVAAGMSIGEIADVVARSKTTVRHWLVEYGMKTAHTQRKWLYGNADERLVRVCLRHGETEFQRRSAGGYRCLKCRSEAVTRRRRRVKRLLVEDAGGACQSCGYDRCLAALEFHHVEPSEKAFSLSHRGVARSIDRARNGAQKCVLLCANCHAEVEVGLLTLKAHVAGRVQSG
jgi:transposase